MKKRENKFVKKIVYIYSPFLEKQSGNQFVDNHFIIKLINKVTVKIHVVKFTLAKSIKNIFIRVALRHQYKPDSCGLLQNVTRVKLKSCQPNKIKFNLSLSQNQPKLKKLKI